MRKLIATCVSVGLLAGALAIPAEAKKPRKPKRVERVAEGSYENPAIGIPGVVGSAAAGGAVEFPVAGNETFISVEITDEFGQPVMTTMSQNTDTSDDLWEIFATFCGKTEEALPIAPGIPVRVSVYTMPGREQPTCVGPATSGTMKATFSNLP